MNATRFEQQLLKASPEERRRLIARRPASVGEQEVHGLAEQARAMTAMNPVEGLRLAEVAWDLADALGGARGRALALRARAVALRAQARWADALTAFETAAQAAEEAGDALLAAQAPIAATETLAQLGRYEEALALAATLESRLRALGAEEDAAKVVANAGNIYFQREAYGEALEAWSRSRDYFQARELWIPAARLQMNIANVLTHLNRLPEALEMYRSARDTLDAAGMDLLVAGLEGNMGFLQFMAGRYADSLQAYARARQRFETLGLPKDIAQCDRETADVYLELNLIPEAQETYERVIPLFTDMQTSAEAARSELGLAAALAAQGRSAEALEALERAEQAFQREDNAIGVARVQLQRAEWRQRAEEPGAKELAGRFSEREARAALRVFRRFGVKMGEVQTRLHLAERRIAAGGSPVRALRRLLKEAETAALITLFWRIEAALARASRNAGKRRAALHYYRHAVEAVERVRTLLKGDDFQVAFLQDKMRLYEELLALLLDQGTRAALLEGFQLAERAKSRALLELLAGPVKAVAMEDAERQALVRRLEALRQQLNWNYARNQQVDGGTSRRLPVADTALPEHVTRLEREYLRSQRELQLVSGGLEAPGGTPPVTLPDLQALLSRDEQIVEYMMVGDEVLAYVVDRRRFRTVRGLASRAEVEQQVERLRLQWSRLSLNDRMDRHGPQLLATSQETLEALYGMLLEPLEDLLSAERLHIIPHGILHNVPFHALYDGACYALDRWEFAYAPSGAVWRTCRLRGELEAEGALVYGVADPGIAHVRDEIAGLRRTLPYAQIYEDEAATLAAVPINASCRYLHFATHGIFRKDNPLFSALRMADGWLIAHDLYHRRLECSLATLSACRTGVSIVAPGDELLGLVRGFLNAGARAVMVSLWTAHDAATAELMQCCYSRMAEGLGRAAALRAAQQAVREQYPHPYYWAAFALVGAP